MRRSPASARPACGSPRRSAADLSSTCSSNNSPRTPDRARRRRPRPHRARRRAAIRGGAVDGALLRGVLLRRVRAPSEPRLLRPPPALHPARDVEPGPHGRGRQAHAPLALHRPVRGHDVAALPPRPEAVRGMARLPRRAPHEPGSRVLAERGHASPARRAAHVLLARLRLVPGPPPPGPGAAPLARLVGGGRRHAGPRHAQQVPGGAPRRRGGSLRARPTRPATLARTPRPLSRAGHRRARVFPRPRLECRTPLDLLRLAEHARPRRAPGDPPRLDAAQYRRSIAAPAPLGVGGAGGGALAVVPPPRAA